MLFIILFLLENHLSEKVQRVQLIFPIVEHFCWQLNQASQEKVYNWNKWNEKKKRNFKEMAI